MLGGYSKFKTQICLLMVFICIIPSGASQYSDIAYVDVTMTPFASESQTVDMNSNATYIASGYNGQLAIHEVESLNLMKSFTVESEVLDIQFSPDGLLLAFSRSGSSADTDTIQIIDMQTMELTTKQYGSNSHSDMIEWSPDGVLLAVPNSNNGIDILRVSDMEVQRTLNGEHNSRVTCISFSSQGNYILSGDESGRLVMWETLGNPTEKVFTLDSEIKSCSFDSVDERFAVLTVEGQLSTIRFSGGSISELSLDGGAALHWSSDDSSLHVLEVGLHPRILTVDSETLEVSVSIYLAHQALDFTHKENRFGTRDMAFVATNTGHIAVYGAMPLPDGYGEIGTDSDGDNIPDNFDNDDDGDAIPDQRDNSCQSDGQLCSKIPNIETIRSVDISINSSSFVLKDTYTLDAQTSSALRNLSRRSLIADIQLSQEETDLLAQTICKNMDGNHYISSWENIILLSSGELQNGTLECEIKSGMTLTAKNDQYSHIAVTYVLNFNLSKTMTHPFEFSLQSQPSATDNSLAQHAQMHPIEVTARSTNSNTIYWSPWWVVEGDLTLLLEEKIESEPGLIDKTAQVFITYPILFLPILGLLVGGIIVLIRARNNIDLEGGESEEELLNAQEMPNELMDGSETESGTIGGDVQEEYKESTEDEDGVSKSTEKSDVRVKERRRVKSIPEGMDGPITKVKRKRLDGETSSQNPTKKKTAKRKVIAEDNTENIVKTRRVVTYSGEDD